MAAQYNVWDDPVALEQNRLILIKKLVSKLRLYEARYEIRSDELENEICAGRIPDTSETTDWLISWRAYSVATNGRETRLA